MKMLTLLIDNKPVTLISADISFSIDQLAATFHCTIVPMRIEKPLPVKFKLNGRTIFAGTIDVVSPVTSSSEYSMRLSGRSLSANMIDSRITMDTQYNQTLDTLLRSVASPFGLSVQCLADASHLKPIEEFQINGESPIDNIAQLMKEQNLILVERHGVLSIETPAQGVIDGVVLKVGDNIKTLDIHRNFTEQFYHIEVQGQWDDAHAVVTYSAANTQRTKVIIADQLQTSDACQLRAEYERGLAIAKGLSVSTSLGDLFMELTGAAINHTVRVVDAKQGLNETLLVKALTLSLNDSAMETKVELFRPFKEGKHV